MFARAGENEIWLTSKSKLFDPGLKDCSKGTTTQWTALVLKPSLWATAYATALSKPWPEFGSLTFHTDPFGGVPPNQGGKAGLSVPIVSLPL